MSNAYPTQWLYLLPRRGLCDPIFSAKVRTQNSIQGERAFPVASLEVTGKCIVASIATYVGYYHMQSRDKIFASEGMDQLG